MKKMNLNQVPQDPKTAHVARVSKTGKVAKRTSLITVIALSAALCAGCMTGAGTLGSTTSASSSSAASPVATVATSTGTAMVTLLDTSDLFSNRDLTQEADLTDATYITVVSGQDVTITEEGVYVLSGTATDVTIYVEAAEDAKVQLVLDGLKVTNTDMPVIYALTADKLFVTTAEGSSNTLSVTGTFAEGSAAIQSKCDLTLNGEGTLTITSSDKGIKCSDDLKITGGAYKITASDDGIAANESIRISDGTFTIKAGDDAIKAENDDDDTEGFIYISGGTFSITASDDGIRATTFIVIDGGDISVNAVEGIEATYIQLNGGTIDITASDDGINAASKSTSYSVCIEINGGEITIDMGAGDTDAIDSNGALYINGGTVTITAQSPFDYDGVGQLSSSATVIVNGQQITTLSNQMIGGGMMGGMSGDVGQMPGDMGDMSGQSGQAPDGSAPGSIGGSPSGQMGPGMRA